MINTVSQALPANGQSASVLAEYPQVLSCDDFRVLINYQQRQEDRVKLRIRDNSIRLRLMRGEVEALNDSGVVSARTGFPGGRSFSYVVESSPASVKPAAFFSDNVVTIRIPETAVLAWASSEQVSIESEQLLDDGDVLKILVEKDFACLAPRDGEEEADMFPHPETDEGHC